jgi:hypothetical protein
LFGEFSSQRKGNDVKTCQEYVNGEEEIRYFESDEIDKEYVSEGYIEDSQNHDFNSVEEQTHPLEVNLVQITEYSIYRLCLHLASRPNLRFIFWVYGCYRDWSVRQSKQLG